MEEKEYLTESEACALLGVSRGTLYNYVKNGRIRKYTRGITRRVYYSRAELERLNELRLADDGQDEEDEG